MSTNYICELYYGNEKLNWQELMRISLDNLGFVPGIMTIYQADRMLEEVDFNESLLLSLESQKDIPEVTLRAHSYDETQDNPWFRIGSSDGKFVSLKWSNTNLDFLLKAYILGFLKLKGFTAGYAFENNDVWEQNAKASEQGRSNFTLFPGQFIYTCGMQFMAAPLMWFGTAFFELVSKQELLKFPGAYVNDVSNDIVCIRLFDLYDDPCKDKNRDRQKQFWSFFELEKIISQYEEKNSVDASESLRSFLAKKK